MEKLNEKKGEVEEKGKGDGVDVEHIEGDPHPAVEVNEEGANKEGRNEEKEEGKWEEER